MLNKPAHSKQHSVPGFMLFILALVLSTEVSARTSDAELPMNIEADKMILQDKKGISQYLGNVKIVQGSREIIGDTITIHADDNKVIKVVIKGRPASFSQLNDADEKTQASSMEMIFYAEKEILVLQDNAILKQKDNVFKSDRISYNTEKDIISAGDEGTGDDQRVKITIHPKKDTSKP